MIKGIKTVCRHFKTRKIRLNRLGRVFDPLTYQTVMGVVRGVVARAAGRGVMRSAFIIVLTGAGVFDVYVMGMQKLMNALGADGQNNVRDERQQEKISAVFRKKPTHGSKTYNILPPKSSLILVEAPGYQDLVPP